MAEGWSVDPAPLHLVHERLLADPDRRQRLFLASVAGGPAGAASYVAFPRSAYLLGAVVLPRLRSRGVYRALARRGSPTRAPAGSQLATCHARESTSAPILERLGFATIRRFAIYFVGRALSRAARRAGGSLRRELGARVEHDLDPAVLRADLAHRPVLPEGDRRQPRRIHLRLVLEVVHDRRRAGGRAAPSS